MEHKICFSTNYKLNYTQTFTLFFQSSDSIFDSLIDSGYYYNTKIIINNFGTADAQFICLREQNLPTNTIGSTFYARVLFSIRYSFVCQLIITLKYHRVLHRKNALEKYKLILKVIYITNNLHNGKQMFYQLRNYHFCKIADFVHIK